MIKTLKVLFVISFLPLVILQSNSSAQLLEQATLAGTKWNVFILQFPMCWSECGGATVTFDETQGTIIWNDTRVEGLPFPYLEETFFNNIIPFTVYDAEETFALIGWGLGNLNKSLTLILYSCTQTDCMLNYLILGRPL